MRQRKIKNVEEKIKDVEHLLVPFPENPEDCEKLKGHWHEIFGNDNPIYLEIGCGKGQFITGNALAYPDRNFIAVEGQTSIIYRAMCKIDEEKLKNVKFFNGFIKNIEVLFDKRELDGIYLNFSDPWPKERHAKRRLTYGENLKSYTQVVKDGGFIQFKTDNDDLFQFTLDEIDRLGLTVEKLSRDLHNSIYNENNITTEYEDKFSAKGKNINFVVISAEQPQTSLSED